MDFLNLIGFVDESTTNFHTVANECRCELMAPIID